MRSWPRRARHPHNPTPRLRPGTRSNTGRPPAATIAPARRRRGICRRPCSTYGGLLDRYGAWAYAAPYGDVWYPRVDAGWSPYSDGAWSFTASFGWFWVGADRWSWPTHHYGRWGRTTADRWFWIPDNRWGPAWVSWASAPGYIGWSPLGFDNRPVIALRSGRAATWRSWTVLSTRTFRPGVFVDVRTRPRSLPAADRFVTHRRAPGRPPGVAAVPGTRGTRGAVVGSAVPRMAVPRTFEVGGRRADVNRPMSPPSRTVLPSTVGRASVLGLGDGPPRRAVLRPDASGPALAAGATVIACAVARLCGAHAPGRLESEPDAVSPSGTATRSAAGRTPRDPPSRGTARAGPAGRGAAGGPAVPRRQRAAVARPVGAQPQRRQPALAPGAVGGIVFVPALVGLARRRPRRPSRGPAVAGTGLPVNRFLVQ